LSDDNQKTIFVSIASYRDPDCINTVRSLFEKAAYPERLVIGICWQFAPNREPALLQLFEYQEKFRQVSLPVKDSRGPCFARHLVQKLWQGEDYYFQVDSHMRFVSGWDEKLIGLSNLCPSKKPVLSTYPLPFTPPDEPSAEGLVEIRPRYFDEHGVLHQDSALLRMPEPPPPPSASFLISAGMLFAPGRVVREVPYDPNLYFTGEEIILALRLWTHGWDIFNPNAVIAYHNYQVKTDRRRHWEDQAHWNELNRVSFDRVAFLTGQNSPREAEALKDMDKYGLGSERSIEQYQQASGLNFSARTWHGKSIMKPENPTHSG
jgi:hypothetical protein